MKRSLLLLLLVFPLYVSADVTFYSECEFKGQAVALAPGDYTATEMLQFGIAQNSISSVDVPRGLAVTLYENDFFRGRYGTLKRSDPCLENDRFDDIVSSVSIRESLEVTVPAVQIQADTGAGITVFTECEFKGQSATLGEGDYNLAQLEKLGISNNVISSVKVADGYSVTLFDNDFLRGRAGTLRQDHNCLARDNFDDIVSSVSVIRNVDAIAAAPEQSAAPASAITLYSECNYRGKAIELMEGEFTATKLAELGLENNSISSIRVSEGFQVELFENDFYRGASGTLRQNDECLVDDRFNDTISSLIVSPDPQAREQVTASAAAADDRLAVTVFGHCDYKGGSIRMKAGKYNAEALRALRIADNVISSFKIEKGFQVTLFDAPDFSGEGKLFTANDNCLEDDRLDEKVSSLIIEPLKVVSLEDMLSQLGNPVNSAEENELVVVNRALECVQMYVAEGLCKSHLWSDMLLRCELADIELMTDGYLRGHIDAGNCKTEYWNELSRRVANPQLR